MKVQPENTKRSDVMPTDPAEQVHKPLTLSQNLVLTIKVLFGAAIVLAGIVALGTFSE